MTTSAQERTAGAMASAPAVSRPLITTADLPDGHYIVAELSHVTSAAVPRDDPLAPLARRWLSGKREAGDEEAIRAWLADHPEFEITRLPAGDSTPVPAAEPCRGQLALWGEAA